MPWNSGYEYRERLGPDADGEPLVAYLERRYDHSSLSEWKARIDSGCLLVDSRPAQPDTVLHRGQLLVWRRPAWEEPEVPLEIDVLFEDDELIAVDKPAGLPTLPGGGFLESTLLHRVRLIAPGASPVHRLGRWTSGVVLFARTRRAGAELVRQWTSRAVRKRYRALASGKPASTTFRVEAPIGPVPHALLGSVHAASTSGKPSSSRVVVLERRDESFLCDVFIETGRPHQIRIHLAASGHPLVGDPLYPKGGVPEPGCRAVPGDPGYHLHSVELTFRHPTEHRTVTVECVPPRVLRESTRGV